MLALPAALPVGILLIIWAAIRLGSRRAERRAPLIVAITVLSVTIVVVTVLGLWTLLTLSTEDGSVRLIEG